MTEDEIRKLCAPPSAQGGSTTVTKYSNSCATKTELSDYIRDNPNASVNDIMLYFNYPSKASVRNHLTRVGLIKKFDKPRMTPNNQTVIDFHKNNPDLSMAEISRKTGIGYQTVLVTFRKFIQQPNIKE